MIISHNLLLLLAEYAEAIGDEEFQRVVALALEDDDEALSQVSWLLDQAKVLDAGAVR